MGRAAASALYKGKTNSLDDSEKGGVPAVTARTEYCSSEQVARVDSCGDGSAWRLESEIRSFRRVQNALPVIYWVGGWKRNGKESKGKGRAKRHSEEGKLTKYKACTESVQRGQVNSVEMTKIYGIS